MKKLGDADSVIKEQLGAAEHLRLAVVSVLPPSPDGILASQRHVPLYGDRVLQPDCSSNGSSMLDSEPLTFLALSACALIAAVQCIKLE